MIISLLPATAKSKREKPLITAKTIEAIEAIEACNLRYEDYEESMPTLQRLIEKLKGRTN